jgi:hypothetical protein
MVIEPTIHPSSCFRPIGKQCIVVP